MKRLRWQLLVVLVALVAIGILLAGQQPTRLLPNINSPLTEPVEGGIYTEALLGSYGRLNPLLDSFSAADRDVNRLVFSGLMRFDSRGAPHGDLVDTYGISADGSSYSFALRDNAVWHDGQPVLSEDVVFTVGLLRDEALPISADLREFWKQVEVDALDEKTVQFHLPEPFAPFLDYLTFGVLPKHVLGDITAQELIDSGFNLKPVGSGPFRFDHLIVEGGQIRGVALESFSDYYGQKPYLEQVVFRYYPDAHAALQAFRAGEVLGISQITPEILAEAVKEPDLSIYTSRIPRLSMVFLNLGSSDLPFFQDSLIRQALLMSINRQWMVDRLLGGQGLLADGPILPGTWAYYEALQPIAYDPEGALALVKEAGYTIPSEGGSVRAKDGVELRFELVYPDEDHYTAIAETLKSSWERLGMQVELKAVSYEQLVGDYLDPRTYEAALVDLNLTRAPDPDPYPFWHQAQVTGGQNYSRWDDRRASEDLEQARVLVDMTERARRYRNFQVRFQKELPALPLFYGVYSYGVHSQVQGVRMGPLFDPSDRFSAIEVWSMVSRRVAAQDQPTAAP